MLPFIETEKPVFAVEYSDMGITLEDFCLQEVVLNFSSILKDRGLDTYREACP